MSEKPQCLLEGWYFISGHLYGKVYRHPRFENGTSIKTSSVISEPGEEPAKEGTILETRNSFYILGKPGVRDGRNY